MLTDENIDEDKTRTTPNDERPIIDIIVEILRLLGRLLGKMGMYAGKKLLKLLAIALYYTIVFCIFLYNQCKKGIQRLIVFWNDKNTQEKIQSIKSNVKRISILCYQKTLYGIKTGAKYTWKGLKVGARYTLAGIVFAVIHTWNAIIHLKSTIVSVCKWMKRTCVKMGRGTRLLVIKRKRAYAHFRRNKGFKGLLIDISNAIKRAFNNYMDEDASDNAEARTMNSNDAEEDIIEEDDHYELTPEDISERGRLGRIAVSIYNTVKKIVEE